MEGMTPSHLSILQHSLGVDQYGRGNQYRNHYAIGPGQDGFDDCLALCEQGLMQDHGTQEMWGGMHGFFVTEAGKKAMLEHSPEPPKLTRGKERYRRFLQADCGLTFGQWLKRPKLQE